MRKDSRPTSFNFCGTVATGAFYVSSHPALPQRMEWSAAKATEILKSQFPATMFTTFTFSHLFMVQ